MPVKRRLPKQRTTDAAQLEAWSMLFECGRDYLGDLVPFGFPDRSAITSEATRYGARKAWRRLGSAFMATWQPTKSRPVPWAFEEFGPPE